MMKYIQNLQFAYRNDEIDDRTLPPQNTRTKLVCLDVFSLFLFTYDVTHAISFNSSWSAS